jgi:hypothetical protein
MGLNQSPDWAQATMEEFWDRPEELHCSLNDLGLYDNLWANHVNKWDHALGRLHINCFSVSPLKCKWAFKESSFLGYWMTPTDLKPWTKQSGLILPLETPTLKQLCAFIAA